MSLDLLFPNFETLIRTPEDVARLNEAILQLAVQGKLVPQDPADEPASELLKRIRAEKRRLVKEGKIREEKPLSPIKSDETPYRLPSGWLWAQFGIVTLNRDGERVPLSKEIRENRKGLFDYYGASGVIDKIDDYLFDKPLLLIGEDGANLINRSTPIAFIARGKYWVNNHAHVLDSLDESLLEYLRVHINAIDLTPYVTGTAQPKMNQAKMNSIPIALPPLAEQCRIVAKVESLFAQTRALEAKLRQAEELRRKLVQAVLHSAFS
jgi:type I restriction enzyme, S subunit